MGKKPKLTKAERLLRDVRNKPSPTYHDPKQINLLDLLLEDRVRKAAFDHLDRVIRKMEEEDASNKGGA